MSTFVDLLAKDGSVTVHIKNLRVLSTKMFKVSENMLTELMQGRFRVIPSRQLYVQS